MVEILLRHSGPILSPRHVIVAEALFNFLIVTYLDYLNRKS